MSSCCQLCGMVVHADHEGGELEVPPKCLALMNASE